MGSGKTLMMYSCSVTTLYSVNNLIFVRFILQQGRIPAGGQNTCRRIAAEVTEYCETTFD